MEIDYDKRFRVAFEQIIRLSEDGEYDSTRRVMSLENIKKIAEAQLRNLDQWKTGATKSQ